MRSFATDTYMGGTYRSTFRYVEQSAELDVLTRPWSHSPLGLDLALAVAATKSLGALIKRAEAPQDLRKLLPFIIVSKFIIN